MPPTHVVIPGACPHDCPDRCSWLVTVAEDRVLKLVGDAKQPFTQGVLCAKVSHDLERVYSPERVLYPRKRVGAKGDWWVPAHSLGEVSAKALTSDGLSDPGGGGDWHDTWVDVQRVEALV